MTVGQRFGLLVVTEVFPPSPGRKWPDCLVRCDCGSPVRRVLLQSLRNGSTVSCGCRKRAHLLEMNTTHGQSRTAEYGIWVSMNSRCSNPNHESFVDYGGRGIGVCVRWRDDFEAFFADMGPRPSPAHTIDRRDNDGGYSIDNCRWATQREQSRNTSRNVWIEYQRERMVATDWAARYGLSAAVLLRRIARGWPIERALKEPARHYGKTSTAQAS